MFHPASSELLDSSLLAMVIWDSGEGDARHLATLLVSVKSVISHDNRFNCFTVFVNRNETQAGRI
jgi:hypothetical protein